MRRYISPVAPFNATVAYKDGSVLHYRARERPHVVLNRRAELTHLISAVGVPGDGGNVGVPGADRTFTHFQPIAGE